MAVVFGMFDSGFHGLLNGGFYKIGGEVSSCAEIRFGHCSPDNFQNGYCIADGHTLAEQVLQDSLDYGQGKGLGNQILHNLWIVHGNPVQQLLRVLPGE